MTRRDDDYAWVERAPGVEGFLLVTAPHGGVSVRLASEHATVGFLLEDAPSGLTYEPTAERRQVTLPSGTVLRQRLYQRRWWLGALPTVHEPTRWVVEAVRVRAGGRW